jgi:biotin carboxyl carrier protein
VNEGDKVTKGQPMMTIESMKILTVITAPSDGEVSQIHFEPGDTFEKNATLITLTAIDEE